MTLWPFFQIERIWWTWIVNHSCSEVNIKIQLIDTKDNPFITLNAVICSAFVLLCLAARITSQLFKILSVETY